MSLNKYLKVLKNCIITFKVNIIYKLCNFDKLNFKGFNYFK